MMSLQHFLLLTFLESRFHPLNSIPIDTNWEIKCMQQEIIFVLNK